MHSKKVKINKLIEVIDELILIRQNINKKTVQDENNLIFLKNLLDDSLKNYYQIINNISKK